MSRLSYILESWLGTSYMDGQRVRGHLASCVGFYTGVQDTLCGVETDLPALPRDAGLKQSEPAKAFMRFLQRTYGPVLRVKENELRGGDTLVVGQVGPGHLLIVDPLDPRMVWHCAHPYGVSKTSLAATLRRYQYHRAYRNDTRWLPQ